MMTILALFVVYAGLSSIGNVLLYHALLEARKLSTPLRLGAPSIPPYRQLAPRSNDPAVDVPELHAVWYADRYQHALEAIATLNQDAASQRIAKQALGAKPFTWC
jgi:hypothetical protein